MRNILKKGFGGFLTNLGKPTNINGIQGPSIGAMVGVGADIIGSFMPLKSEYSGDYGSTTQTMDSAYDSISDAAAMIPGVGTGVSALMKGADVLGQGLNALGGGTDGMSSADSILGSSFFSWNIGAINGFGGKKANNFKKDQLAFNVVGSSYGGTNAIANNAQHKAGKKYGLVSSSARKKANEEIAEAGRLQFTIGNIANREQMFRDIQGNMADIVTLGYANQLKGGYNLSAVRAAKIGGRLTTNITRIKNIAKAAEGIQIKPNWRNLSLGGIKKSENLYLGKDLFDHLGINMTEAEDVNNDAHDFVYGKGMYAVNKFVDLLNSNNIHEFMNSSTSPYYNLYNLFKDNIKYDPENPKMDDEQFKNLFLNSLTVDKILNAANEYQKQQSFKLGGTIEKKETPTVEIQVIDKWIDDYPEDEKKDNAFMSFLKLLHEMAPELTDLTSGYNPFIHWMSSGKPEKPNDDMYHKRGDKYYAYTLCPDEDGDIIFTKGPEHDSTKEEVQWYNSKNPKAVVFRMEWNLVKDDGPTYKYVKKPKSDKFEVIKKHQLGGNVIAKDEIIKQLVKEWPVLADIDLALLEDPEFLVYFKDELGNSHPASIKYISPRHGYVQYLGADDFDKGTPYIASATPDLPTIYYNPKFNNLEAIKLDSIHALSDYDPKFAALKNKLMKTVDTNALKEMLYDNANNDILMDALLRGLLVSEENAEKMNYENPKVLAQKVLVDDASKLAYQDILNYLYQSNVLPEVEVVAYLQKGGQMNVIPEGALHARLHHMENTDSLTKKGIPVVDNEGNLQAEVEKNEIILRKKVTDQIEKLRKLYKESEDDDYAIKAGKLLVKEILDNTDDRTGLIELTA